MFARFKYILKCIVHIDCKALFRTVNETHRRCGKNRIFLFFDIVFCGLKYGAGYKDYLLCEFFNLNSAQRKTYVTREVNNHITRLMNSQEYYHCFDNKHEMYNILKKYIGRKYLYCTECTLSEFKELYDTSSALIIKPEKGSCGRGVEKINTADFKSAEDMLEFIKSKGDMVAEEVIIQNEILNKINPYSINTLRIVTILSHGKTNVVYAFIRIGTGKKIVDNINAGGMCAPINLETGKISHEGYDKNKVVYQTHPDTGCTLVGFQIPFWEESLELCRQAAKEIPQMGYLGWDVAVTPTGPVLVEGNNLPGHDILQMPPHVPDKIGMLPQFRKFVDGI